MPVCWEIPLAGQGKDTNMVRISILMSVFNGADTLAAALDSVLAQTFAEFELIVCDDASTDGSWEILRRYQQLDPRVVIFQNDENMGLGASLNRCLARAQGPFIARQDADDISAPDRLEKTLRYLLDHDLPYAACGVYVFDDGGVWSRRLCEERVTKHSIARRNPFFHPTMLFRREVLELVDGYRVADITRRTEDYDLVMRLAARDVIGQNLQEYLYYVYEPAEAYLRHSRNTRLAEIRERIYGLRIMHSPPWDYLYLVKPVIMMLIPRRLLRRVKELQWGKQGDTNEQEIPDGGKVR